MRRLAVGAALTFAHGLLCVGQPEAVWSAELQVSQLPLVSVEVPDRGNGRRVAISDRHSFEVMIRRAVNLRGIDQAVAMTKDAEGRVHLLGKDWRRWLDPMRSTSNADIR